MKLSTGFRKAILDTGSFKATFAGLALKIYDGTPPATADAALSGNTMLCEVSESDDGVTGLTLEAAAAAGVILKNAGETWQGTIDVTGTATFFRFETFADTGTLSTTALRLQGSVALAGADLNLSSTSLTATAVQDIDAFAFALPAE